MYTLYYLFTLMLLHLPFFSKNPYEMLGWRSKLLFSIKLKWIYDFKLQNEQKKYKSNPM